MNNLVKITALFLIFMGPNPNTFAQSRGIVNYKYLGIQFNIPEGWVGQEVEGGYLIGSHTEPGFALISTHQASTLEEIKMEAEQGIVANNGTNLKLNSGLENVGENGLGGEFKGILEGQSVTTYMIGLLNPYGGEVSIMATTTRGGTWKLTNN